MHTKHSLPVLLILAVLFSACEYDVTVQSDVHADGSIDRTLILNDVDSIEQAQELNIFNATSSTGWEVTANPDDKEKFTFRKHFASADEANSEMDREADTLFRIRSTFEKRFRWLYTYTTYSDTYIKVNSFNAVPQEDYFTEEDYAFIDRLPAEGKPISNADSLYLELLNEKIFDRYGSRTLFEELFGYALVALKEGEVPLNWTDSLYKHKEKMFRNFADDGGEDTFGDVLDNVDGGEDGILQQMIAIGIPVNDTVRTSFREKTKEMERRINFVSKVNSAKFTHIIRMPGPVTTTNADSVAGDVLVWKPPVIKFLLKDYTMHAESRTMNLWAVVVSVVVVLGTVVLFIKR